ncbi:unnamed protein product [Arctia plantaginis]|uniref:Uncharacterized protein n=1 Tax=Arctia plantaginis TaxID=874455 RepID=A0A8S0YZK1_ARCPL|nr:unnamed protein product [Arctia plantaginis]CAB3242358.1 unnamed protein product [Arctia plantaginis]
MNKNLKLLVAARGRAAGVSATGSRVQPIGGGVAARSCAPVVVAAALRRAASYLPRSGLYFVRIPTITHYLNETVFDYGITESLSCEKCETGR